MTEQTPIVGTDVVGVTPSAAERSTPLEPSPEVLDLQSRLAAAEEAAAAALEATGTAPRYAVYDTRYEKFVGAVLDKKPTPAAAKKLAGHDDVDIREV
jgi:hypothetical protein